MVRLDNLTLEKMKTFNRLEACAFAGVSGPTLSRALSLFRGRVKWGAKFGNPLPHTRVGIRIKITRRDLVAWMRARAKTPWWLRPDAVAIRKAAMTSEVRAKIGRGRRAYFERQAALTRG